MVTFQENETSVPHTLQSPSEGVPEWDVIQCQPATHTHMHITQTSHAQSLYTNMHSSSISGHSIS